jgi:tetratricopeptide (TPR) repeat protein
MLRSNALLVLVAALACGGGSTHDMEHGGQSHPGHKRTHVSQRFVPEGAGAPLFSDLGDYTRSISTTSELAARYFDQGLILAYGFNHAEALRSFQEASRQDPGCAICAWGEALVLGPNINKPMDDADVPAAYAASRRALSAAGSASPVERALIEALATRYAEAPVPDRSALDLAYANAMRSVAERFPDDLDVQTLFAEALMDTMPWDYFVDPGTPKPATVEVLAALEDTIARAPRHPGALHLYIHAVEPSSAPERAEPAADTLGSLAPGAGHLVHMPSHIYLRVGRYHDASVANELAASADESYITQCRAQGFYPAAYYPHNVHFLYASAAFEGRSAVSIEAARKLSANMTAEIVAAVPVTEEFAPMELFALARFGRWSELAEAPAPPKEWRYVTGVWHFTRGMAAAATGDTEAADANLAALTSIASEAPLAELYYASGSTPSQLLTIGTWVLRARIASEAGDWDTAVASLEEAVVLQEALPYTEPPPWYFPTREALGQTLLRAGRPADAEATFREQLAHTPRNGWSLFGLVQSLDAQKKATIEVEAERKEAWRRADIELQESVF